VSAHPDTGEGDDTPVKHVSLGDKSLDRESITVGHADVPVRFYRVSHPPIFAGFQISWMDGNDPETKTEFDLSSGAGLGSKYMTLAVTVPGHKTVHEYVDITEVLEQRVIAIMKEMSDDDDE